MKLKYLFFISLSFLNFSCRKYTDEQRGSQAFIRIKSCVDKLVDSNTIRLCFDELIEDSRCPKGGVCIWQGVARARFSITANGEYHWFELSTLNMPTTFRNATVSYRIDTLISGYKIKLVNITPFPGESNSIAKAELEITGQ